MNMGPYLLTLSHLYLLYFRYSKCVADVGRIHVNSHRTETTSFQKVDHTQ